jgi:hypothetical protein
MRPDGISVLPPVGNKTDVFCILEHKRMSDVCDRYLTRAKRTAEDQYVSLRSTISEAIQRQGWKVEQISFITGARSVNKQDLSKNQKFFRLPEASIQYSTGFSGDSTRSEGSPEAQPTCTYLRILPLVPISYYSITSSHKLSQ